MLALPADAVADLSGVDIERDNRPAYRPFRVTVAHIWALTPHFTRVTFTGPTLAGFGTDGLDQRIKLVLPLEGIGLSDFGADDEGTLRTGDWYTRWRDLPDAARNPIRTYTVRAVRPADCEIDVDFVTHASATENEIPADGPASRWLGAAAVGDEILIVGPDSRSRGSAGGIDFHPGGATNILLAGDETAAPAICSILESLAPGIRATAFIEVPTAADALPIASTATVSVAWLSRETHPDALETAVRGWIATHRSTLVPALASESQELEDVNVDIELIWDSPFAPEMPVGTVGTFYAWLAGESATIKSLRRFLVTETGIDRARVAFMGYWRRGKAEAQ